MNKSFRRFSAVGMAGVFALLLGGHGAAFAQQVPEQRPGGRFVTAGAYHINLDQVRLVKRQKGGDGNTRVLIQFVGVSEPLSLVGNDADTFMAAVVGKSGGDLAVGRIVKIEAEASSEAFVLLANDGFDGKLGLNWKPVRPDPSHVSFKKTPGALTITTQRGSIHGE